MDKLVSPTRARTSLPQNDREAYEEMGKPAPVRRARQPGRQDGQACAANPDAAVLGRENHRDMPLEIVLKYLHKPELYRLSWGAKNTHGEEWDKLEAEFEARLARMSREAVRDKSLRPQAVYGFFPAASDGEDLVDDRQALTTAPFRLRGGDGVRATGPNCARSPASRFPRQPFGDYLCLSDYFAPVDSGQIDVVALQVVTVGRAASEKFEALQGADQYSEAYFFHGLAVQAAEATANYVHRRWWPRASASRSGRANATAGAIRPARNCLSTRSCCACCPPPPRRWTDAQPGFPVDFSRSSTAAIIVHHPDAKYFSVGVDRVAQIEGS